MKVQITKKRILKFGIYTLAGIIGILLLAFLVLQIPAVQQALLKRYLGDLNLKTNFKISTTGFNLYWFDRVDVNGLRVIDPEDNEMIYIEKLHVNFELFSLSKQGQINIDGVTLDSAKVRLVYIVESDTTKDVNINEWIAALNKLFAPPPGRTPKSPKVNIGEVVVTNSFVSLHHPDRDSIAMGFDHNHFKVQLDDSELRNFKVIGDTIQFNLLSMVGKEIKNDWPIHEMRTFFRYSQGGMEFLDVNLKAGLSTVSDTVIMTYSSARDLSDNQFDCRDESTT